MVLDFITGAITLYLCLKASYVAQCYSGMESILKRIAKFRNITLTSNTEWHIELLKVSRIAPDNSLGILDDKLFSRLSLMRKFRHVVIHGYGFKFDRDMVLTAINDVPEIVSDFFAAIDNFLVRL